ncbi:hypothetical protein EVAR_84019_1 [Eumeta japonica]|uniref:Uncharacterized protein n=1 Tax=Eumeta variegata TaxID=151549 RepID=A0A4C1X907_EUMVA|nr:hypothetical protein EVAR_84019_1 [Eumeta japonica]
MGNIFYIQPNVTCSPPSGPVCSGRRTQPPAARVRPGPRARHVRPVARTFRTFFQPHPRPPPPARPVFPVKYLKEYFYAQIRCKLLKPALQLEQRACRGGAARPMTSPRRDRQLRSYSRGLRFTSG